MLTKPREALGQVRAAEPEGWDPRLSARGNRVSKQLAVLLDRLAWVENFLECRGWTSLVASGSPGPGPGLRPAGTRRAVRGGGGRRPGRGDAPSHEQHLDSSRSWRSFSGGASIRRIAPRLQISRRTVRRALGQSRAGARRLDPPVELPRPAPARGSQLDAYEAAIADLLARHPDITVRRIYEELRQLGYTGGYTILSERVRRVARRPGRRSGAAVRDRPGGPGTDGLLHL